MLNEPDKTLRNIDNTENFICKHFLIFYTNKKVLIKNTLFYAQL